MRPSTLFSLILLPAVLALAGLPGRAAALGITSPSIAISADPTTFIFGLATASTYSLPNASMTFGAPGPSYTSHIVINANGIPYDLSSLSTLSPLVAVGTGTGAYLEGVKDIPAAMLHVTVHYEISDSPEDGSSANTMKVRLEFQNYGTSPVTFGARLEYDTMVNGVDGANVSINNGVSVFSTNALLTQAGTGIPGNWWAYDIAPPATANLVTRGSLFGNPFGEAATQPDALEIAAWSSTASTAQWTPAAGGLGISDSSVVLWWTGTGGASGPSLVLAPGASTRFVTYYGLNTGVLLSTFTPTPVPGTATDTPTPSLSPTITLTLTPSLTPTSSPTITVSSTVTPTLTPSATSTSSPTVTMTPTFTQSYTFSATPTITATCTISPTWSASPTVSPTPTISPTFTISPTPINQAGPIDIRQGYPNPFSDTGHVIMVMKADGVAEIKVYNVAGEIVYTERKPMVMGSNLWDWAGQNDAQARLASGIYVVRATVQDVAGPPSFLFLAITR